MKLINKLTLWYLCVTILVLMAGGVISYYLVVREMRNGQINRLRVLNNATADRIRNGASTDFDSYSNPVSIAVIDSTISGNYEKITEQSRFNNDLNVNECRIVLDSYYRIAGKNYKITSANSIKKAHEISMGLVRSFVIISILLLLLIGISARIISNRILLPFKNTMRSIQSFRLNDKKRLRFSKNTTREFTDLNNFLETMTDAALDEYSMVKEFGENTSHELQTPLAIIRSKLDILAQSDIDEKQSALIGDIQKNIEKLARINQSLTLLNQLENREYDTNEFIPFCRATKESISGFGELMEMKGLTLTKNISKEVTLRFHPALAEILLNNLLSNAIRHNIAEGKIEVTLSPKSLLIRNTGKPLNVPPNELFKRFKKGNPTDNSIGIGLAIVKQICDQNNLPIEYTCAGGWHSIEIFLPPQEK